VIVLVGHGANKKEFQVHRGLLAYSSASFQYLLRNEPNTEIGLPMEDPFIFEIIVYWMYTARFWTPDADMGGKIPLDLAIILRIYFFATGKGMNNLQNAAMTLLYYKNVELWKAPTTHVNMIYANTAETSPLRTFLINFMADTWGFDFESPQCTALPNRFLVYVLVALRDLKKPPGVGIQKAKWVAVMNKNFCRAYHVHGE
jgi:hypothetical protein